MMQCLVGILEHLLWRRLSLVSASIVTGSVRKLDETLIVLMVAPVVTIYSFYELNFISSNHELIVVSGKCHSFAHHTTRHFSSNLCYHTLNHRTLSHDSTTACWYGSLMNDLSQLC